MTDAIEAGLPAPSESEEVKQPEQNTSETTAESVEAETKQAELEKTFTQAEVDALVQKRLLKEERRVHRRIEQQMREQAQIESLKTPIKRESFADDDAFIQAQVDRLAELKASEKLAERERKQQSEKIAESFHDKAEKASDRYADFNEVVSNPSLSINDEMVEFIADSELGADLAYYLGKNPTKAAQIASMSAIKAARELARIESELGAKPQVKTSNAPPPITPVGSKGSAAPSLSNADFAEYKALRAKQGARWAR